MKRTALAITIIAALLISTLARTQFVNLGRANPFLYEQEQGEVPPPNDVNPPTITIFSPKNNSAYVSNSIPLAFNVSAAIPTLPELFYYYLGISEVYYKASWLSNNTYFDIEEQWKTHWGQSGYNLILNFSISLTGVPEGANYLEVFAVLGGSRETYQSGMTKHYGRYSLVSSSMVEFTVEKISILSPQHKIYNASDIPLVFKLHESYKQISYSLDGQDNVIVDGNLTLTGLSDGEHNITAYATDEAGNTGASETLFFNVEVPEPFSVVLVAAVSAVVIAVATCAGFLLYFKKQNNARINKHSEAEQSSK